MKASVVERLPAGTFRLARPVPVTTAATVAGRMEAEGPYGNHFDRLVADDLFGEGTWERAEVKLLTTAVELALGKANLTADAVDLLIAGDLLDQLATTNFAARTLGLPVIGVFAACATSGLGLAMGGVLVASGYAERVVVATASHHLTAERQYRYPVELGNQRKPTQQWTATGAAAFLLGSEASGAPQLTHATIGRVQDLGVKDVNNMGAAMAPAAADTILRHLRDTGRQVSDYDRILTGDLGVVGSELLQVLLAEEGVDLGGRHADCGLLLYDRRRQDVHAGGSGAACSALVLGADVLGELRRGTVQRVLFVPTGSLHSVTSFQQGESIPVVAHAVALEGGHG